MVPALKARRGAARLLPGLLAAAVSIAGCGGPAPPLRERFYALEPAFSVAPTRTVPATLLVAPLRARGFAGGTQIVFRTRQEPLQVQRYHDFLWEQPPGGALAEALVAALRAAQVFAFVVTPADRARADLLLSGELVAFEHLPTDDPPRVRAELGLNLVDAHNRATRFAKTYSGEEPIAESTPAAMVEAFDRLSARLVRQVVRDLQALAPRLGAAAQQQAD